MSDPFGRHSINHLSPSSLALYRAEPHLWCLRYLHRIPDEADKPAAWRGSAVETGLDAYLYGATPEESLTKAQEAFEMNAQGEIGEKLDKQRDVLASCLRSAIAAFDGKIVTPNARQMKIEAWVDGVPVPVMGYVDYTWPDYLLDLKTTERRPSKPSADHLAQIATYHRALKRQPKLLYAAPSGFAWFSPTEDEVNEAWRTIEMSARALMRMLTRVESANDASALFAPRFDDFRWTPQLKEHALKLIA
ncbi:MAG: PD-(D/E)XK nuclease family protein [Acetobacteraceae bacterium]